MIFILQSAAMNCFLVLLGCFALIASGKYLTASPDTIVEGLTHDLTLRCSVSVPTPSVSSVLVIQLEKDINGSLLSLATMHADGAPELHSTELSQRANVTGHVDQQNLSASYLQMTLHNPQPQVDKGLYLCTIMGLDPNNLLTQIKEQILVNGTDERTGGDIQETLKMLMREIDQLKSRENCACANSGPDDGVAMLLHELQQVNDIQAQEIVQLRQHLASFETRFDNGDFTNKSVAQTTGPTPTTTPTTTPTPTPTATTPVGFLAVGRAGSVQYTSTLYNTHGSFHPQTGRFVAPAAGFYFFHAYDARPQVPLLALMVNERPIAVSAKAVPVNHGTDGQPPVYSSLSVSGLVSLSAGDVATTQYMDDTQSMGASFAGALVSTIQG